MTRIKKIQAVGGNPPDTRRRRNAEPTRVIVAMNLIHI